MAEQDSSDEELMARYYDGDDDAFALIYVRHRPAVYAFLDHKTFNPDDTDDLTAETFYKVGRTRENRQTRFDPAKAKDPENAKFVPWLLRIANRTFLDKIRRKSGNEQSAERDDGTSLLDFIDSKDPDPLAVLIKNEQILALRDCVSQLTGSQRKVIWLFVLKELGGKEVAEILGKTEQAVNNLHGRAKQGLKKCLESKGITGTAAGQGGVE